MLRPQGHPLIAAAIDLVMAPMDRLRPRVVQHARGRTLEIGAGTGLNFAYYADDVELVAIEPDPHMLRRARARAERLGRAVELVQTGAEALPFEDDSFDTVVATWVFCTIPDAAGAAAEVARVLKPGGVLLFVEHVHSDHAPAWAVQHAINPAWKQMAGGCQLVREPVALLEEAGLEIRDLRPWGGERWTVFPMLRGDAHKAP